MHLRPEYHRDEYQHGRAPDGYSAVFGPEITIEPENEGRPGVVLTFDPLPGETFDDREVSRTFTAAEARELAAMLWHHADEQDRLYR